MFYHWIVRPFFLSLLRILYALLGGFRCEGREYVPRRGGLLVTPNHISDADPTAIALALPRPCYYMAKEELFQKPILGPLIRLLRAFPVKRYTADRAALRQTEQLLEEGEAVVLFPEGKVSEDGQLQPLLPGALLVAQRANVPLLPAVIFGTDRLLPYAAVLPRHARRRILVRFGRPITVEELTGGLRGSEGLKQGAERLRAILLSLQQSADVPQTEPNQEADPNLAKSRV
jgi:1-acyl-sn-glycerol-3-phosphate acyltransferase